MALVLGIESSCDDTAAAILRDMPEGRPEILSNVVMSQTALHANFGGVVPEIAARAHAERLDLAVEQALAQADVSLSEIDAVAVTSGPGLIGGVLSGVMFAKGLSASLGVPLISVNHLAGHALTPRLTDATPFPYLMLLVSGGHCQFLLVHSETRFTRLGGTIDDAPGEAFDKAARLLGLGQPGGPAIEVAARDGNASAFKLPRPLLDREGVDLSFSGLKTALLRARDGALVGEALTAQAQADLAAGFQAAVVDVLEEKTRRALRLYCAENPTSATFAIAGGVAANGPLRAALTTLCKEHSVAFAAPPLSICTDNAAMIAYVGLTKLANGDFADLALSARPRWPLDTAQEPMLGSGKKGAKA